MKPSALFQPWAAAAADDSTDHVEAVELIGGLDGIDGRVAGPRWDAIDEPREFGKVICPKLLAVSLKTYDG